MLSGGFSRSHRGVGLRNGLPLDMKELAKLERDAWMEAGCWGRERGVAGLTRRDLGGRV